MSFFDDKQDILKVELTTYGRFLISRGKFKPAYYAFFDDDVLYDGEYADVDETQNSIQTRILEETPCLKPQTTFTSLENNVKLSTLLSREIDKLKTEESQISADKNYALSMPLANSDVNSDYAPAWALQFISGTISSSSQYIDNSVGDLEVLQPFIRYPQIELKDSVYDIKRKVNSTETEENYDIIHFYLTSSNQYYYSMREEPIVLDLKEMNVENLAKNFDVELFVEEEEIVPGTDETKTILRQLSFKKDPIDILNGILLDEPMTFNVIEDEGYCEYYFEMTVDDQIELTPQQLSGRAVGATAGESAVISSDGSPLGGRSPFGDNC